MTYYDPYHRSRTVSGPQARRDPYVPVVPVPQQHAYPTSPAGYMQAGQPQQRPTHPQQVVIAAAPPTSGWAVASLVFGLLGVFGGWRLFAIPCAIAVLCGHIGLGETKTGVKGGRGMAVAGLILGYVVVGPALAIAVLGGAGAALGRH